MAKLTNWDKFVLLLWKNWILQWNHKIRTVVELVLPLLFTLLIVLMRLNLSNSEESLKVYEEKDVMNSYGMPYNITICYSPSNDKLDNLVKNAFRDLNVKEYASSNGAQLELDVVQKRPFAGIQFDDAWANLTDHIPDNFQFSLRFPSITRQKKQTWLTKNMFPSIQLRGQHNYLAPGYYQEGFLALQQRLSLEYIREKSGRSELPKIIMEHFPYPAHTKNEFLPCLTLLLPSFIILSFLYPFMCVTRFIAAEKEKQLKEVMKIMGLRNWLHWTAWFVKTFIPLTISAILVTTALKVDTRYGAVLENSSFTVVLFFLIVYIIASICFCFMMATLFSKASTAATVTSFIWLIAYIPYFFIFNLGLYTKLGWSLIPNTAMSLGFKVIVNFEEVGDGLQWSTLFSPASEGDPLTVGAVIIMMLVSSIMCMIICLYIEQVMPGNFGVPRPWNFPFTREFWSIESIERKNEDLDGIDMAQLHPKAFEMEPEGKHIGVRIKDLRKKFADKTVVRGLTMNMFKDEITVLLGHNGAGKTTTVSMLTGMIPPTSGAALINGYDITANTEEARMSMGICPQHNVLFDEMSVSNHIRFFSRIKGLRGEEVESEVAKYLKMIELEDKANEPSSKLSGGMKRKLSVCCALVGGTKVVICDEPSSGMDPAARRQLWDLLQKEKVGRTLLLTTHFMDEADVLGDRIAIMCDGKLECLGTSFFLKKQYGSGYRLICVKGENCATNKVTALLNRFIPGLQPVCNIGAELSYQLPDQDSPKFEEMFSQLEDNSEKLHLNGYGVSITSLEEVFMKVGAEKDSTGKLKDQSEIMNGYKDVKCKQGFVSEYQNRLQGLQLLSNQLKAMLLKKLLYTWRNKLLLFVLNVIPVFFLLMTYMTAVTKDDLEPMTFSLTQYDSAVTVLDLSRVSNGSQSYKIGQKYADLVKSYSEDYKLELTDKKDFEDYILKVDGTKQTGINSRYLVGASFSNDGIVAWLNNQAYHTAPLTINLVHNAMAKALVGPQVQIQVTNAPVRYPPSSKSMKNATYLMAAWVSISLYFGICFVSSMYVLFPIKERGSRAKLLQFVGGVKLWIFWLSQFIVDFATHFVTSLIVLITIMFFKVPGFMAFNELGSYFVLLLIYGFSVLPFTYLMALFYREPATGFARTSFVNIFLGFALVTSFIVVVSLSDDIDIISDLYWSFHIFPQFSLGIGIANINFNVYARSICAIGVLYSEVCDTKPDCCIPFLSWRRFGVFWELIFMTASGILSFLILFLMEFRLIPLLVFKIRQKLTKEPSPPTDGHLDDDVDHERKRILYMTADEISSKNLVLDRVTKYYGQFRAVDQVSLCVKKAECFGLLGVNGAGKTTTFKMMTGEEWISSGAAHVQGRTLGWDMGGIYKMIGYCPQFDALPAGLTGREVLRIFCLLRGIPQKDIRQVSENLANSFGFMKHMDKRTDAYSGGNKRKLSTAIAVIGSPSVIYLDEPTTGMDPAARRQLWNMVSRIRESGKSIILTSHSMEECEALCTRLAIMVNGEFKCLGSTQHLKNKFSKGLILRIKVRRNLGRSHQDIDAVKAFVRGTYPHSILRDNTLGLLTFYIPLTEVKWSRIFGMMEKNRIQLNVEDYSISQTTLEEIFLEFAKNQREESTAENKTN
ncbi:ATP-binding cassette sub-family A member 3-like [Drosophila subpulchrella]|uniref:ATP-binding cassette sub-family A member 3-like n=1 Tax=Drosophila subpulchrella TaxID=1486046 RepID=UPI0018A184AC|nr:ATP-binding cassette sub-family A member 3-like [Drosophila subpulchrella]